MVFHTEGSNDRWNDDDRQAKVDGKNWWEQMHFALH
jgi:hypothetical protein